MEGIRRVEWLPGGDGYFLMEEEKIDGENYFTFKKVNPKNGKESPLFKEKTVESLMSQYNSLTGKTAKGIPFRNFNYVLDNKSIYKQYRDNGIKASNGKYNWSLMDKKLNGIYSGIL